MVNYGDEFYILEKSSEDSYEEDELVTPFEFLDLNIRLPVVGYEQSRDTYTKEDKFILDIVRNGINFVINLN